jgi:hypothetical protein
MKSDVNAGAIACSSSLRVAREAMRRPRETCRGSGCEWDWDWESEWWSTGKWIQQPKKTPMAPTEIIIINVCI